MKKRKRNKKSKKIMLLFVLVLAFLIYQNYPYIFDTFLTNFSDYSIIYEKENPNYTGRGQQESKNSDGYFTIFTTEETHQKIYKEYKQNEPAPWFDKPYWGGTMEENGCGITALSIILSGYGKNVTPEDLREKYYPVLATEKISTELSSTFGIQNSDFYFDSTHLSKKSILEHLQSNRPILICVWNQPRENRWTEKSHYMVLLATARKRKSLCF